MAARCRASARWLRQPDKLPDAAARLADEVTAHGLDGVACYADYAGAGLIAELAAGAVTTYACPAEAAAEHAVWQMAEPSRPAVKVQVSGRLVVRISTAG